MIKPCKATIISNSRSCTTREISKLLTSCLTAIKKHTIIKYCEKVNIDLIRIYFGVNVKNSGEVLDKLKASNFNATSFSTYDFPTL